MSAPRDRMAEVLRKHAWYFVGNLGVPGMPDRRGYKCPCGWRTGDPDDADFEDPYYHVAGVLAEQLGLTQERDRYVKCTCGHPKMDHLQGRGADCHVGRCDANKGTRHTPCDCREWTPAPRHRYVTPWVRADDETGGAK